MKDFNKVVIVAIILVISIGIGGFIYYKMQPKCTNGFKYDEREKECYKIITARAITETKKTCATGYLILDKCYSTPSTLPISANYVSFGRAGGYYTCDYGYKLNNLDNKCYPNYSWPMETTTTTCPSGYTFNATGVKGMLEMPNFNNTCYKRMTKKPTY